MSFFQKSLKSGFDRAENLLDKGFGAGASPLAHLGSLGFFCYWIVAVSGIYLYIAFDTSIVGVYESVEYLTHDQWYLGGILRSFHRYVSDAMVLFMFLHLAREYANDRFRAARAFSWITGVPVIVFVYASGISGYWLVWDQLAQYIAVETTQWLDWFPIFGESIARNFLDPDKIDDRFFSLLIFMHIFVPLFLLALLWLHIQRISKPDINPPRALCFGFLAMLLGLSLLSPATSHLQADLSITPPVLDLDWYYLGLYPLFDVLPAGAIWAIAGVGLTFLVGIPYLPRPVKTDKAVVDLDNCNGCTWCLEDCPYSAISMVPRTDGKPFDRQASVSENLCVGCGICAGSCPTGSPYRRGDRLAPGIELKDYAMKTLRQNIDDLPASPSDESHIAIFRCEHSVSQSVTDDEAVGVIDVPCIGMVPPSFIDYALTRKKVEGVLMIGCPPGRCKNRLGTEWTKARLARERDPRLRNRIEDTRISFYLPESGSASSLNKAVSRLRDTIREAEPRG